MKMSVSIPDSLWDDVRAIKRDPSPSKVMREALEQWVEDRVPRCSGCSTKIRDGWRFCPQCGMQFYVVGAVEAS